MSEKTQSRSPFVLAVGLFISIAICFAVAGIGGYATASSVDGWFQEINKPSWNPPDWVFAPVWTTLYLMMGISAWLVWKSSTIAETRFALGWFGFHLVLNLAWSLIFFGLQQPGLAAFEIVILWLSIVVSIWLFSRHSKLAAGLLIPYLLWVTFASVLNVTIWSMN